MNPIDTPAVINNRKHPVDAGAQTARDQQAGEGTRHPSQAWAQLKQMAA
jgi:hypothetical protein